MTAFRDRPTFTKLQPWNSAYLCFSYLFETMLRWQWVKLRTPDVTLPTNASHSILGNPKASPGQMRRIIPPECFGSTLGSPASWTWMVKLQGEVPRRHPSWSAGQTTSTGSSRSNGATAQALRDSSWLFVSAVSFIFQSLWPQTRVRTYLELCTYRTFDTTPAHHHLHGNSLRHLNTFRYGKDLVPSTSNHTANLK